MDAIKRLHADTTIDQDDGVAVTKDGQGQIKLEGATNRAAGGVLAGKLGDAYRIDDFLLEVGDNMPPGSSALLMLVHKADPDKALAEPGQYGGKVIRTTLPDDAEARIRSALGQTGAGAA